MSRNTRSLKEYEKRLKPKHLGPGDNLFTITHVAEIPQPRREKITFIGGDEDNLPISRDEKALVLYFREAGMKAFTLNTTNRDFLIDRVSDDPSRLIGCIVTLKRVPLPSGGFGVDETIKITAVRKPGQAASTAEQQANEAIQKKKLAELSTRRKQEKALMEQLELQQEEWKFETVKSWPLDVLDEKIEQLDASIAHLTERIQNRKIRKDLEARMTTLRMEAQLLGEPPSVIDLDNMTDEEIQAEIERAAGYVKAHSK